MYVPRTYLLFFCTVILQLQLILSTKTVNSEHHNTDFFELMAGVLQCDTLAPFQTKGDSALLYWLSTWTLTKTLEKALDGNYIERLEQSLTFPGATFCWKNHNCVKITVVIKEQRLQFTGHFFQNKEELLSMLNGKRSSGRSQKTNLDQLISISIFYIIQLKK